MGNLFGSVRSLGMIELIGVLGDGGLVVGEGMAGGGGSLVVGGGSSCR